MIRYTVVWHRRAEDDLAEIWLTASDRDAVTAAAGQADTMLSEDPELRGTRISPRAFELYLAPLYFMYQVSQPDRLVRIFSVIHS